MPLALCVNASVVDLRGYSPTSLDVFLVDSNVWYWATYSRASLCIPPPRPYQTKDYPDFIDRALEARATLHKSGLSLAELFSLIENSEWKICMASHGNMLRKEFRYNRAADRRRVAQEVESAWAQANKLAVSIDTLVDDAATESFVSLLKTHTVDGDDSFMLEAMRTRGISQVITDDADFARVPDIRVYTANVALISAARRQNRLLS